MSRLNLFAFENMSYIETTLFTFQPEISWLNETAYLNIASIKVTEDTFHEEIS
jgi:hypothetical protein